MIFQIIAAVVWEMRILCPLKGESTLQEQPPKSVLQIYVWQLLLKSFKNVCEGFEFKKKKWNEHLLSYSLRVFISFVKQLCYTMAFL